MRGVSEVVAIILILLITIAIAGLAYGFMSTTMSDITSSSGSTVDSTTSSMLTSFTLENMDIAKVYVRNTGNSALESLSVYVNDEPAVYNVTTPIAAGAVGTITIYSFIPDGATVKVTSPSGFSASKVSHPCEKAVGCWKFDEGTGTVAYDSSPSGNTVTIYGANYTTGVYGNGLLLDGVNDYVKPNNIQVVPASNFTISFWLNAKSVTGVNKAILQIGSNEVYIASSKLRFYNGTSYGSGSNILTNTWYYAVFVFNNTGVTFYLNGNNDGYYAGTLVSGANTFIGSYSGISEFFNGTIDEVRVYNRAIY